MKAIISVKNISTLSQTIKAQDKTVVLIGGCFDVLHPGHIIFLEKAKQEGDVLVIFLESDQKIKQTKGQNRPFFNQLERAEVLQAVKFVDFVVLLPFIKKSSEYDLLIKQLQPNIIAVTAGLNLSNYQRSAQLVGAELKKVTKIIGHYSTSQILKWGLDK